jgi:hypothetical protein
VQVSNNMSSTTDKKVQMGNMVNTLVQPVEVMNNRKVMRSSCTAEDIGSRMREVLARRQMG